MELKPYLLMAAVALPMLAHGVPAKQGPLAVKNADGTVTEILLHGDEYFSYATDVAGNMVMERNASGMWDVARRNGSLLEANESNIGMLRAEQEAIASPIMRRSAASPHRIAALDEEGRTTFPCLSTDIHSLVILMEFADTKFTVPDPVNTIGQMLNKENFSAYGGRGSARDYYIASSAGKFTPTFDVAPLIVSLPETSAYYVGGNRFKNVSEALSYAVKAVDDSGFDFSKYDYDNDGVIDTIFFYFAGYGQADTGNTDCLWPHQSTFVEEELTVDGLTFAPYACSNELDGANSTADRPYLAGVGTFIHEFGHVLGLADFYDTSATGNTVSPDVYDLMANGSYNMDSRRPPLFNAYERWVCRWLDFDELGERCDVELEQLSKSNKAYRLRYNTQEGESRHEFFMIETRGNDSWDESLPDNGILITHLRYDEEAWLLNKVNVNGTPRFQILRPYAEEGRYCWGSDVSKYIAPMLPKVFSPADGTPVDFTPYFLNIGYDAASGTGRFRYSPSETDDPSKPEMDTPTRHDNGYGINLSWSPVEGAVEYLLTVYRYDSKGKISYVQALNERPVGNVTKYSISDLPYGTYRTEMYVHVRAVTALPCSEASEELHFTPSSLEAGAGVNTLTENISEIGAIYNLQGGLTDSPRRGDVVIIRLSNGKTVKKIWQ